MPSAEAVTRLASPRTPAGLRLPFRALPIIAVGDALSLGRVINIQEEKRVPEKSIPVSRVRICVVA